MSRTATQAAQDYARQHPQQVRLCWVDHRTALCSASEAVHLCAVPRVAARLIGAVAEDKLLEDLLNRVIDGES